MEDLADFLDDVFDSVEYFEHQSYKNINDLQWDIADRPAWFARCYADKIAPGFYLCKKSDYPVSFIVVDISNTKWIMVRTMTGCWSMSFLPQFILTAINDILRLEDWRKDIWMKRRHKKISLGYKKGLRIIPFSYNFL